MIGIGMEDVRWVRQTLRLDATLHRLAESTWVINPTTLFRIDVVSFEGDPIDLMARRITIAGRCIIWTEAELDAGEWSNAGVPLTEYLYDRRRGNARGEWLVPGVGMQLTLANVSPTDRSIVIAVHGWRPCPVQAQAQFDAWFAERARRADKKVS